MSEMSLVIETGNNAFSGGRHGAELARILREIAARLEGAGAMPDGAEGFALDMNGNRVARWLVKPRAEDEEDGE